MALPDAGVLALMIAAIGAFSTGVANFALQILQYKREDRAHRWAVEQSEQDRRERHRDALDMKAHTDLKAEAVQDKAIEQASKIVTKIEENTAISQRAFKEANDVNKKILAIGEIRLRKDTVETP